MSWYGLRSTFDKQTVDARLVKNHLEFQISEIRVGNFVTQDSGDNLPYNNRIRMYSQSNLLRLGLLKYQAVIDII